MQPTDPADRHAYHHGDLRRALLLAAEDELTERGIEGFTLRGCAKRAGVSHAAPAHHFKDVSGLLAALATEGFRRFLAALDRRAEQAGDDPEARLICSGLGYVEFARANPALFRLMFASNRPDYDDAALTEAATASFQNLVDKVSAVSGGEPLTTAEGRRRIAALWAIAHGMAELVISRRMKFLDPAGEAAPEVELAAILAKVIAR